MKSAPIFQAERLNRIAKLLQENGYADINDLSALFSVSAVTIRRDVDVLVARGLARRAHGGVLAMEGTPNPDEPYQCRTGRQVEEKQRIGREAAALIQNGDVIYLDAGTTTLQIARNLRAEGVTVITNDLHIAMTVAQNRRAQLMVAGGQLVEGVFTLAGDSTAEYIRKLHVQKAFIGCDAIHPEFGVSNRVLSEVPVKLAAANAADEVILVTDSSKLYQKALYSLFPLSRIDTAILDGCDTGFAQAFAQAEVRLITAEK